MYDQVYWTLTFGDHKHYDPIHLRPALRNYTIYIDGISKSFAATGVRVGWTFGPQAVDPIHQISMMEETSKVLTEPCADVLVRSLEVEEKLQKLFKATFDELECMGYLTLGMNDHIMNMANNHDTYIYLLRQRLR